MTSIKVIGALLAISFCYFALRHLRKGRLSYNYLLWWGSILLFISFFGLFPSVVDWIGHILRITYPPILIVIIAILLLLIKMLIMDVERSKHEYQIRILTQKVAELDAILRQRNDNPML